MERKPFANAEIHFLRVWYNCTYLVYIPIHNIDIHYICTYKGIDIFGFVLFVQVGMCPSIHLSVSLSIHTYIHIYNTHLPSTYEHVNIHVCMYIVSCIICTCVYMVHSTL